MEKFCRVHDGYRTSSSSSVKDQVGSTETESSKFLRLLELDFAYFLMLSSATVSLSTKIHNGIR